MAELGVSFLKLPVEVIIQVLSYLEVSDLNNIAETCQALNQIINDEELWKNLFIKRFHTNHFSSVSNSFKFSLELFERSEILHRWKKSTGIHKTFLINTTSLEEVTLSYPKIISLSDQGDINISSIDKGKTDITMPLTTPSRCTSYSFNSYAAVFGRIDGKIYGKLLATRSYLSSPKEFSRSHGCMVTAIDHDDMQCYSGDEQGNVFIWDMKNGEFTNSFKVSNEPIVKLKGRGNTTVAIDSTKIYILEHPDKIRSIEHNKGSEFFQVDLGAKAVLVGNLHNLYIYSFHDSSFGRSQKISIFNDIEEDEIYKISLESKRHSNRDVKIAGHDGCNLGILTKKGIVSTYNIRDTRLRSDDYNLQKQCEFTPIIDNLKIPDGIPPICSISINSSVVLLGSYNGFAAVYDVLTGEFIKLVSSRIPKRYLNLTQAPYLIPVKFIQLSPKNQTNGILIVNNAVQYFQFGKSLYDFQNRQKKKKVLTGVVGDRKDKLLKKIKHDIHELNYEDYESYKQDQLLDKYNGSDITMEEEIELAMVLNKSMNDQNHNTGKELVDLDEDIDEELSRVLEMSRLDQGVSSNSYENGTGSSSNNIETPQEIPNDGDADNDDEFEKQIQEALKRSLYE
ncbi:putative WD repeat-containing protein [Wickerhamomyces ciferrii]|uniref:WD repeat-containing protein n=1 Tax=Wickerhamomyces ciferrii (strain ATCC 14091 / BCRC 22168 / CBS 111 / JCM 3599 / NBRC 0793 / NRRL Y-1031 F-60-10) TaxID=1206466 RepID=K0KQP4_WICCF|nr:putative WD repeat-containing protein [Wickerhamomyces ciferrii]CCH45386.1 putative WD repeat-containing protein [Wickerhamomyces ciferrii]